MKIHIYFLVICTLAPHATYTMEAISDKVNKVEQIVIMKAHKQPVDSIINELKLFLDDPTLSCPSTEQLKDKLVERLSTYTTHTQTAMLPNDNRTVTVVRTTHYVDGTTSMSEDESELCLDRTVTTMTIPKKRSPWYNLSLDSIIKLFLQNYRKH